MKTLVTILVIIAIGAGLYVTLWDKPKTDESLTATTTPNVVATSSPVSTSTTVSKPTPNPTPKPTPAPSPTPTPTPTPTPEPTVKTYTMADISLHNSKSSCFTAVNGKAYDITSYIPKHPGGEREIMKICGKDGTSLFEGQHGGDSKPEKMLASFYLGVITN